MEEEASFLRFKTVLALNLMSFPTRRQMEEIGKVTLGRGYRIDAAAQYLAWWHSEKCSRRAQVQNPSKTSSLGEHDIDEIDQNMAEYEVLLTCNY
jgi:hypothetical protein